MIFTGLSTSQEKAFAVGEWAVLAMHELLSAERVTYQDPDGEMVEANRHSSLIS